ncbi:hypothetical protein K0M31_009939 [Melipona bicolor]|uniref:Uncharacterized protein n=1 Tax=Melipona bicolor TaxID=60889 RepID=A0AA40KJ21_9HYME|nr:hypothetical protein K0M31_009939 [Melipona bicolor]
MPLPLVPVSEIPSNIPSDFVFRTASCESSAESANSRLHSRASEQEEPRTRRGPALRTRPRGDEEQEDTKDDDDDDDDEEEEEDEEVGKRREVRAEGFSRGCRSVGVASTSSRVRLTSDLGARAPPLLPARFGLSYA